MNAQQKRRRRREQEVQHWLRLIASHQERNCPRCHPENQPSWEGGLDCGLGGAERLDALPEAAREDSQVTPCVVKTRLLPSV